MLSFIFRGSDSIIVANTTTKIVAGTGIANKANIAPAANPIVPSKVLFLFHGNLCLPYRVPMYVAKPSPRASMSSQHTDGKENAKRVVQRPLPRNFPFPSDIS
jgi:hypothetical protein